MAFWQKTCQSQAIIQWAWKKTPLSSLNRFHKPGGYITFTMLIFYIVHLSSSLHSQPGEACITSSDDKRSFLYHINSLCLSLLLRNVRQISETDLVSDHSLELLYTCTSFLHVSSPTCSVGFSFICVPYLQSVVSPSPQSWLGVHLVSLCSFAIILGFPSLFS